jgi:hypothetical protein
MRFRIIYSFVQQPVEPVIFRSFPRVQPQKGVAHKRPGQFLVLTHSHPLRLFPVMRLRSFNNAVDPLEEFTGLIIQHHFYAAAAAAGNRLDRTPIPAVDGSFKNILRGWIRIELKLKCSV